MNLSGPIRAQAASASGQKEQVQNAWGSESGKSSNEKSDKPLTKASLPIGITVQQLDLDDLEDINTNRS